jgi:hypothetical protein
MELIYYRVISLSGRPVEALSSCRTKNEKGVVKLWTEEREETTAFAISSSGDHLAPRAHRRGAEGAMRSGRGQMALDVEGVVDGGVG